MQNSIKVPALDLPAHMVDGAVAFGTSLERISFAQLVALAGRIDRSRESCKRMEANAASYPDLSSEFLASAAGLGTQLACWFDLVEAEIERRLARRATVGEA